MSHDELEHGTEVKDPRPREADLTEGEDFTGDYADPPAPGDTHADTAREGT